MLWQEGWTHLAHCFHCVIVCVVLLYIVLQETFLYVHFSFQIRAEDYVHSIAKFEELVTKFASKPPSKALADGYCTAVRVTGVLC